MKRQPIFGIDAVRFFAAMAVILFHLAFKPFATAPADLHLRIGEPAYSPPWAAISWWGWIGVQIFFVVSGLVIAYSASGATPFSFFRSRVARLLPAMLICATFILVVALTWGGTPVVQGLILWAKSVLFFPFGPWLSGQFWTLGVEIFFYGVVWLLVVFRAVQRIEVLAWMLALASATYWAVVASGLVHDDFPRLTNLLLLQNGCYFAIGIALSIADGKGMPLHRWMLIVLCGITAWFQIAATLATEAPAYVGSLLAAEPFVIWAAITAGIAASLYWKDHIARFVGAGAGYLRAAGLATYPLYLIHMHAGGPVVVELVRAGAPHALAVVLAVIASIVFAYAIALYLEPPIHRFVLLILNRLTPAIR